MLAMQIWNQAEVVEKKNARGAVTLMPLSRKAYGEKHGVKGQQLKREHEAYLVKLGVKGNTGLAAMIASGDVLTKKVAQRIDKDGEVVGLNVQLQYSNTMDVSSDPKVSAQQLTDAELLEIIEQRKQSTNTVDVTATTTTSSTQPTP